MSAYVASQRSFQSGSTVYYKFLWNWDWRKSVQIVSNRQKSIPVYFVVQNSSTAKYEIQIWSVLLQIWGWRFLYYKTYWNRFLPIWNDLNRFASVSIREELVVKSKLTHYRCSNTVIYFVLIGLVVILQCIFWYNTESPKTKTGNTDMMLVIFSPQNIWENNMFLRKLFNSFLPLRS